MKNLSRVTKFLSLTLAAFLLILFSGNFSETSAQQGRDPFSKNPRLNRPQRPTSQPGTAPATPRSNTPAQPEKPKGPVVVTPPPIESRIDYYKRIREQAALNGGEIPKVTSVLLLSELSVTGIFKTPRGYAAMVEAMPIKLSYTIYPGEKFFDGQLVAVEENRLVFRKVTKWSNNKFVSSVENKALRKYSLQQNIQGTAPNDPYESAPQAASNNPSPAEKEDSKKESATPSIVISPLEEMNNQPPEEETDSAKDNKSKKGKVSTSKKRKRS